MKKNTNVTLAFTGKVDQDADENITRIKNDNGVKIDEDITCQVSKLFDDFHKKEVKVTITVNIETL